MPKKQIAALVLLVLAALLLASAVLVYQYYQGQLDRLDREIKRVEQPQHVNRTD